MDIAKDTIEHLRGAGIEVPLIVRCREQGNYDELIALGADEVIPEMLEASLLIGEKVLNELDIEASEIDEQIFQARNRHLLPHDQ